MIDLFWLAYTEIVPYLIVFTAVVLAPIGLLLNYLLPESTDE